MNWVKKPAEAPADFVLDGVPVSGVTADLRTPERSTGQAARLPANSGRCFQGVIPVGDGFILSEREATRLLERTDAPYRDVVRPYLKGEDIPEDPLQRPRNWIIDFAQLPLEEAARYSAALAIVRDRVQPSRAANTRKSRREKWWLFGEQAIGMRRALSDLPRYIAAGRVGKRLLLAWQEAWVLPSDKAQVFAFDDDYSMGVLSSLVHTTWAWSRSSTLKADLNYTPSTAFETFPWPDPATEAQRERVAAASRRAIARRQEICASEKFGLTKLYNLVSDGAYTDLRALHRDLDEAVAACYGWPRTVTQDADEIARRLLLLNRQIAVGERAYNPFHTQDIAAQFSLNDM